MTWFRATLICGIAVVAAAPAALAGQGEPRPMPGLPSDCCAPPPRCLEFDRSPRLVVRARSADVVAVQFVLARRPVRVRAVKVDGRPARVHRLKGRDKRAYRAILRPAGLRTGRLKVGRRYIVRIDVDLAPTSEDCLLALTDDTPREVPDCSRGCLDTFAQHVRLREARSKRRGG